MITKTREYIKNHPRFAWTLCGVIFIAAILIFLLYLYRSFAPPPGAATGGLEEIFLVLIVFLVFVLVIGGIVGLFWLIYHKTKEEFST
jgi:hypothetical protein